MFVKAVFHLCSCFSFFAVTVLDETRIMHHLNKILLLIPVAVA